MDHTRSTAAWQALDRGPQQTGATGLRSVLLVDDQPAVREWLAWHFRELSGYGPLVAFTRSQAHAWLAAAAPWERVADVVLIDVSVPGSTLEPLMEALCARRTEAGLAPVMLGMTTMSKGHYQRMPDGLQTMLYKPFHFRLLSSLLSDYLGS